MQTYFPSKKYVCLQAILSCLFMHANTALDLVAMAKGFALLHLPRMPELRGVDISSFVPHPIAPRDIKFKDKPREKQRQKKLEQLDRGSKEEP